MSSSKFIIILLMLIMSMMMMPRVPTMTAAATHPIEHCLLRKAINPPSPPPPTATKSELKLLDFSRVLCRDSFRRVSHYVKIMEKLPLQYMEALCNIYDDDQEKVESFVNGAFFNYNTQELMNGETCSTVKEKMLRFAPPIWEDNNEEKEDPILYRSKPKSGRNLIQKLKAPNPIQKSNIRFPLHFSTKLDSLSSITASFPQQAKQMNGRILTRKNSKSVDISSTLKVPKSMDTVIETSAVSSSSSAASSSPSTNILIPHRLHPAETLVVYMAQVAEAQLERVDDPYSFIKKVAVLANK
ncbi:hypothetical protein HN873_041460 [Arachis hypogaea]|uniref:Uncharacterized protein n=1 Tax=Arachis hypogaea TaxID=3818 RepID=A0A445AB01_ARAHY|nr:hypothetical protein Ahy_B03g068688 [Arachis hypogaea]